jgi:hypothetical protein
MDGTDIVTFDISVIAATAMAALAGFVSVLSPDLWVPFYRAGLSNRSNRSNSEAALYLGRLGQAVGTALIGLLVTIFVLGVVGIADGTMQFWGGFVVMVMSIVYFLRAIRGVEQPRWDDITALLVLVSRKSGTPARPIDDPFGAFDDTPGGLIGHALATPGFIAAPMFVAASVSGTPSVVNGLPVVIAFVIAAGIGIIWVCQQAIIDGPVQRFRTFVGRSDMLLGIGILTLGIITVVTSFV